MRSMKTALLALLFATASQAQDPRIGLRAGLTDAGVASRNLELVSSLPRPTGFFNTQNLGDILYANSDMAFKGNTLFMGSFRGFQVYDIADTKKPKLISSLVCPGGQGDLSIHGNLLFMSVEMPNGRIDCGEQGQFNDAADPQRFRGVRIFDITDLSKPKQVAAVQTCRGSHTHTLVVDPRDKANVYVYVAGTSGVRPAAELAGCSGAPPEQDPNTALFRIEIIRVPLAAPQNASIVNAPRIFATGSNIAGLWRGGAHGAGTQSTATTDQCHDLTAYTEVGLAAGACSGNGILLDISDPVNPKRIAEVSDPNFAYWHSATFNNDGSKVLFTDEWGGGMAARCQASDKPTWGADAIFELTDGKLKLGGYYKLPVAQSAQENCVAHNGSIVPVPGRDIMVQSWYQGGISVFDFTDATKPYEIAFFDRGAYSPKDLLLGGFWSSYWYNGHIYGSEIGRGLDVFQLTASEHLTQNELDAAKLVRQDVFNPQNQTRITWPAHFVVARALVDQLKRGSAAGADQVNAVAAQIERAERLSGSERKTALTQAAGTVNEMASRVSGSEARRLKLLAETLSGLATQ